MSKSKIENDWYNKGYDDGFSDAINNLQINDILEYIGNLSDVKSLDEKEAKEKAYKMFKQIKSCSLPDTLYDKQFNRYNVIVYKKTILNQYHKEKTEEFDDIEKAIEFGRSEIAKDNIVRIEEVSNIINWN